MGWKSTPLSNKPEVVRKKSFMNFLFEWLISLFIWFDMMSKSPFFKICVLSGIWGGKSPLCPMCSMKFRLVSDGLPISFHWNVGAWGSLLWQSLQIGIGFIHENWTFEGFGVENHPFVQYVGIGRNCKIRSEAHKSEWHAKALLF